MNLDPFWCIKTILQSKKPFSDFICIPLDPFGPPPTRYCKSEVASVGPFVLFPPRLTNLRCDCAIASRNGYVPKYIPPIHSLWGNIVIASEAISLSHPKRYYYRKPFPLQPLLYHHFSISLQNLTLPQIIVLTANLGFMENLHKSPLFPFIANSSHYHYITVAQVQMPMSIAPCWHDIAIAPTTVRFTPHPLVHIISHHPLYTYRNLFSLLFKALWHSSPDAISQSLPPISLSLIAPSHFPYIHDPLSPTDVILWFVHSRWIYPR